MRIYVECRLHFKLQQLSITAFVAWRREAWKEEALDDPLERTRQGHFQSDEHWNCFKGSLRKLLREGGGLPSDLSKTTTELF